MRILPTLDFKKEKLKSCHSHHQISKKKSKFLPSMIHQTLKSKYYNVLSVDEITNLFFLFRTSWISSFKIGSIFLKPSLQFLCTKIINLLSKLFAIVKIARNYRNHRIYGFMLFSKSTSNRFFKLTLMFFQFEAI